ncbi:MAG: MBL fold metallo-hydrolase [Oscillospiraceae bacterium]|nr:MBL fold metallo-hydrolase [Oscillospiraceae bacterium]
MRKYKNAISLFSLIVFMITFAGCGTSGDVSGGSVAGSEEPGGGLPSEVAGAQTFADWTDCAVFQEVPAMIIANAKIGAAVDYGAGNYVIDVNGTAPEDYRSYLVTLEEAGFTKYVDNGEKGLYSAVYAATYQRGDLTVTVTHVVKTEKTYVSACRDTRLSEHLFYKEEYVTENKKNAKTTLHMPELYYMGDCFVFQLKNGHFLLSDGGTTVELPYLLDYLETLVPTGEKPVVEAWMISHAHPDHMGALQYFMSKPEYADRLFVEGVYYNEPNQEVGTHFGSNAANIRYIGMATKFLKTQSGTAPLIYRPQTGQRYYFNDITIDVVLSQDQVLISNYSGDFNDSSTWLMYNIEGQKFLHAGDTETGGTGVVMRTYDKKYFNLEVFSVFHHGINVYDTFTDFCSFHTLLYPSHRLGSIWPEGSVYAKPAENARLQGSAQESLTWGDGTKILTFPYKAGTARSLPLKNWIYNTAPPSRDPK